MHLCLTEAALGGQPSIKLTLVCTNHINNELQNDASLFAGILGLSVQYILNTCWHFVCFYITQCIFLMKNTTNYANMSATKCTKKPHSSHKYKGNLIESKLLGSMPNTFTNQYQSNLHYWSKCWSKIIQSRRTDL